MDFDEYRERFLLAATAQGMSREEVERCLGYGQALSERNLPIIYDSFHLSKLVGYDLQYLFAAANDPSRFYRRFEIKKKSGDLREINEPLPSLKEIQRWILDNILAKVQLSDYAKAFRPEYSIVDNARFHVRQKTVIIMDLKDFFPSIGFPRVCAQFQTLGYHRALSVLLAKLCCLDDCLPQGAPTSPAISNLVAGRLDRRIVGYTRRRKIRYTRYADDLAFSNVEDISALLSFVNFAVSGEGFVLKKEKTRVLRDYNRQLVTGVVVNSRIAPPRSKVRKMRQVMYYINKYGIEGHQRFTNDSRPWLLSRIEGTIRSLEMIGLQKATVDKWIAAIRKIRRAQR